MGDSTKFWMAEKAIIDYHKQALDGDDPVWQKSKEVPDW